MGRVARVVGLTEFSAIFDGGSKSETTFLRRYARGRISRFRGGKPRVPGTPNKSAVRSQCSGPRLTNLSQEEVWLCVWGQPRQRGPSRHHSPVGPSVRVSSLFCVIAFGLLLLCYVVVRV